MKSQKERERDEKALIIIQLYYFKKKLDRRLGYINYMEHCINQYVVMGLFAIMTLTKYSLQNVKTNIDE